MSTEQAVAAPAETRPLRTPAAGLTVVAGALAGLVATALVGLSAAQALVLLGIPDPGPLTTYGLPAARAVGELAAVVAVGSLLLAAFLVPPQRSGVLDADGYRAVRTAATAAAVWAGCAALLVPLTLSDSSGQPLSAAVDPANVLATLGTVQTAQAWAWTAGIAAVLAVACRSVLRWSWTPALLALGLLSLVPLGLTGHSSAGGSHDLATNSLLIHLAAASLWVGGLVALLAHALRRGAHTDVATRRFSSLALVCFVAMAVTGVVNAAVRLNPGDLLTTTYGRLVLAKAVALGLAGVAGYLHRRRSVAALAADPTARGPLVRIAGVEVLLLSATVGLAVGLGRTPPPPPTTLPSIAQVEIGYDLPRPPSLSTLALDWRFDLVLGTAALVLAAGYVAGVLRLRRRGDRWPVGRTVSWLLGCAALLVATSSGLGRYSPAVFSVHMVTHMLLSMLVPVLLVLGGPVTLALRALPAAGRDGVPGPREWLLAALHSRVTRVLTHPVVALLLFVGSFYALYFGGIYGATVGSHAAHVLMNVHFLLSGYLFYWLAIGVDPAPRELPSLAKLGLVFAALPFHAFFGVVLMGSTQVMGEDWFRSLGLGWNTDLLGDQRLGGGIAWATGEIPLVLVMLALVVQWSRDDERLARRTDRAAERDHHRELEAHNAMFAALAARSAAPARTPGAPGPERAAHPTDSSA
ncbi:cytochrome c oxidase assembly protein [Rhodococcus aerolatus]